MNRTFKRVLLLLPVLALAFCLPAMAAYTDTANHWGESAITEWSQAGIVQGANGLFRPDDPITRAELATVITRLLKLTESAPNTYTDLPAGAWYEQAVLCCVQAGIMKGDGGGIIRPSDNVTRQEAIVMLGRAWGISESASKDLSRFSDGALTADWAKGYVRSFVDLGYIKGVGENMLAPTGNINRASVVTILSNAIASYVSTPGEFSMSPGNQGIVLVCAKDVTLSGAAGGMVLITQGASGSMLTTKAIAGNMNIKADNLIMDVQSGMILTLNFMGKGS
ncbi:MAG: S-layer homology domain-containing protein, partial [Clostridia bacterium]|nr:S-layer homology domain-containing protein [Clostridia bacterium]